MATLHCTVRQTYTEFYSKRLKSFHGNNRAFASKQKTSKSNSSQFAEIKECSMIGLNWAAVSSLANRLWTLLMRREILWTGTHLFGPTQTETQQTNRDYIVVSDCVGKWNSFVVNFSSHIFFILCMTTATMTIYNDETMDIIRVIFVFYVWHMISGKCHTQTDCLPACK